MGDKRRRLTEQQVVDIRMDYAKGHSVAFMARSYGVKYYTVWSIVHGRTWKREGFQRICPACRRPINK